MEKWWQQTTAGAEQTFLVVEAKLHDPSAWKREVLNRVSVLVGNAARELLARIERDLAVTAEADDASKISAADLTFTVDAERAERIRALLAQDKRDLKTGKPFPWSNAYRFVSCIEAGDNRFRVVARIAQGCWQDKRDRQGKPYRAHSLSVIPATTGFQHLLATYYATALLSAVPRALRAGVCQEVAQQVTSYLGQLESSRVRGDTSFPTVEDRDPARRRHDYEAAVRALTRDVRPFSYARLRDKYPGKYVPDDPRGDRLTVDDPRWFAVTTSPDPNPIPLLLVQGGTVKILEGRANFPAGVSKRNRHRGRIVSNERVLASRPESVRRRGATELRAWYAALPLLDGEDDEIRIVMERTARRPGRALDQSFRLMPLAGGGAYRTRDDYLLVPLSGNRDRLERILRRGDLEIAWSRLTQKRGDWFLQLTVRVRHAETCSDRHVLGVSFGLDAVATWTLLDESGAEIAAGALAPNEQILAFLREKRSLEWDQQKGRWIGGRRFGRMLESIAHRVANELVALAASYGARLAVEDVSYAQKSGPDAAQNTLFTAWNYGQLRRILGYKAPLAGRGDPCYAPDYPITFTCPQCNAMRRKGETQDNAATWRENGTLHCRSCGFAGPITPAERSRRVAAYGLAKIQKK